MHGFYMVGSRFRVVEVERPLGQSRGRWSSRSSQLGSSNINTSLHEMRRGNK
jgi:hypothetical protein